MNKLKYFVVSLFIFVWMGIGNSPAQAQGLNPPRERLLMDFGWRFALGNPLDSAKDFGYGTSYFSYFAKAGYGDGPADPNFDDRAWRSVNLPHDWAVEAPFDAKGSYSHGFKAIGKNFPDASLGWYRKTFFIPKSDQGRRISVEFDGVFRDSIVWVNGFYLGRESSGYNNFHYDISDYLNYGGENTVSVRVNVTMEEGWFYEGAGIYRHVWLTKTNPLHVDYNGTFVTSSLGKDSAKVTAKTTMVEEGTHPEKFDMDQTILNSAGKVVARGRQMGLTLEPGATRDYPLQLRVSHPRLWSLEDPYLYKLVTTVKSGKKIEDRTETTFGIRTLAFDPNKGFFLNGKHIELKGTANHQDHAGVGVALPDALQTFRIRRLKEMGCNAYRCAHNPPTPELLDACDRLGMLVLVENRLMGTSPELLDRLKSMVQLDRNHPCVFAWSLGNEEWGIEGNEKGAWIASAMQAFVNRLDPTRLCTAAVSGGWGSGTSTVLELMGYNYYVHGNTDTQHAQFPKQPGMGSEESTTHQTRGIYADDPKACHMGPSNQITGEIGIEDVFHYYMARPYLAGFFLWTGFDYRGEETPFQYPAIGSQYGILDLCGFPKDCYYYLKSWWTQAPVLFLTPHWNWKGKEGQPVTVRAFSNCDEVELFLNGESLGKKEIPSYSHAEWKVPYKPGTLSAKGYKGGKLAAEAQEETAGAPASIALVADREKIDGDGEDVSVVTVQSTDSQGRLVPTANNEIRFSLEGPGRIIGVGNGDPSCHEPDRYFETVSQVNIGQLKMMDGATLEKSAAVAPGLDDSKWADFFQGRPDDQGRVSSDKPAHRVVRGSFNLPELENYSEITLFPKSLVDGQEVYVNGHLIAGKIMRDDGGKGYEIPKSILKKGENIYALVGTELLRRRVWENLNVDPGMIRAVVPAGQWKRSLFSGLAQVIVQSERKAGEIVLRADSEGLAGTELKIESQPVALRPEVPDEPVK